LEVNTVYHVRTFPTVSVSPSSNRVHVSRVFESPAVTSAYNAAIGWRLFAVSGFEFLGEKNKRMLLVVIIVTMVKHLRYFGPYGVDRLAMMK
jgi:hypothetical protein